MNPQIAPEQGRTIVFRGTQGEVVVSSAFPEDNLKDMVEVVSLVLDQVKVKGGELSYVN